MRVLPNLTVHRNFLADLAGNGKLFFIGAGRTVAISDESPGLAFNVLPCVKLDHFQGPHLQGKGILTEMQRVRHVLNFATIQSEPPRRT